MPTTAGQTPASGAITPMSPDAALHFRENEPIGFLSLGQKFGRYHIHRLLGKGGMGEVYEAENVENGRRVALKVLSHELVSESDKRRFLREGQLAASVNHPNSVYVYATEEIQGSPVISMELVSGSDLRQLVKESGPLSVQDAVDKVHQLIDGLEAACELGVLHRDIKPSNCYVDTQGQVKIGDYGLSISSKAQRQTTLTKSGSYLGTPSFSSPEQLRGDDLDLRSDIFSLGATLYYLLTGELPFKGENIMQLLSNILEQPPKPPRGHRREIPRGLARVVIRCLDKDREQRYRDYEALRQALTPFSSTGVESASMRLRFAPGLLDFILLGLGVNLLVFVGLKAANAAFGSELTSDSMLDRPLALIGMDLDGDAQGRLLKLLGLFLYFALFEGLIGTTPGKAAFGLLVQGLRGLPHAFLRSFVFLGAPLMMVAAYDFLDLSRDEISVLSGGHRIFFTMFLFITIGEAKAIHDWVSGSRVVVRSSKRRQAVSVPAAQKELVLGRFEAGPYRVAEDPGGVAPSSVLEGIDPQLARKVWIHLRPDESPPVARHTRDATRPTRLRWLNGARGDAQYWDAYEAPGGKPFVEAIQQAQPWHVVRVWLLDLVEELNARCLVDEPMPVLALDRVWIRPDGRAVLLDFPPPSSTASAEAVDEGESFTTFLYRVAVGALSGKTIDFAERDGKIPWESLPDHASRLIRGLPSANGPEKETIFSVRAELRKSLKKPTHVTRASRSVHFLVGSVLLSVAWSAFVLSSMSPVSRLYYDREGDSFFDHTTFSDRGLVPLAVLLNLDKRWHAMVSEPPSSSDSASIEKKISEVEVYIAGHFGDDIRNNGLGDSWLFALAVPGGKHVLRDILERHPSPSPEHVRTAAAALSIEHTYPPPLSVLYWVQLPVVLFAFALMLSAFIWPAHSPFGNLDYTIVTRRGPVKPLRSAFRTLIAWSPFLLHVSIYIVVGFFSRDPINSDDVMTYVLLAGALWSIVYPHRGPHDILAGTYIVPR
ncbi:MAG: protein kinase [Myxococcota bacterium]